MATLRLQKQYITDEEGKKIGVILPIEELHRLEKATQEKEQEAAQNLAQMERAANDPLFLADLQETMEDFTIVDSEWWEPKA